MQTATTNILLKAFNCNFQTPCLDLNSRHWSQSQQPRCDLTMNMSVFLRSLLSCWRRRSDSTQDAGTSARLASSQQEALVSSDAVATHSSPKDAVSAMGMVTMAGSSNTNGDDPLQHSGKSNVASSQQNPMSVPCEATPPLASTVEDSSQGEERCVCFIS